MGIAPVAEVPRPKVREIMDFVVLQSHRDPSYFVITDAANQQRAVLDYREYNPHDTLTPVMNKAAWNVLDDVPDLQVAQSFINLLGYFGHAMN